MRANVQSLKKRGKHAVENQNEGSYAICPKKKVEIKPTAG
jgi:hypothetical protein